jgi:hypothetical protein
MKNNSKSLLAVALLAMLASPAWSVNVTVTLDQLVPVYSSSTFASALATGSATIQIGRIGVSESALTFGSRAAFDTFLGTSSSWSAYGSSVPYEFDDSYRFTAAFEPFVANYGSPTLPEQPYQLYVAITSGSDLFGMYTFRSDGVQVGKFALTSDDSFFFSMENFGRTGGVLNMEAVNSSLGSVRVADSVNGITSAIALIPEPTSGSLLVFGILSLALVSRFRKKTGVVTV